MRRWRGLLVAAILTLPTAACTQETGGSDEPAAEAVVLRVNDVSDRMVDLVVESPALGFQAPVRLILPTSYDAEPDRRYPVLYLLHGCCDDYSSWTEQTDIEALTADLDLIVAIPRGGLAGFYSDWVDGPGWETFHVEELPALLAADYRATDVRAVAGLSMGGLGALSYAARHPGTYAAAASYSGVVHTRLTAGTPQNYLSLVASQAEDPFALWGDPTEDADVWAAHNPYNLAEELRDTALFLSVGNGQPGPLDPPGAATDPNEVALEPQSMALAQRLTELDIPVETDFYGPGTHSWPYWERELHQSWPLLTQALDVG